MHNDFRYKGRLWALRESEMQLMGPFKSWHLFIRTSNRLPRGSIQPRRSYFAKTINTHLFSPLPMNRYSFTQMNEQGQRGVNEIAESPKRRQQNSSRGLSVKNAKPWSLSLIGRCHQSSWWHISWILYRLVKKDSHSCDIKTCSFPYFFNEYDKV